MAPMVVLSEAGKHAWSSMRHREGAMKPVRTLGKYFLRGLIVVVPFAVTAIALRWLFLEIDTWVNVERLLNRKVPGAGLVLTAVAITLVGFLASNFATRWMFLALEDLLERTPLVKLVYTSLKDIVGAFVGEQKKFNRPVMVALTESGDVATLGFVTRTALTELGLADHVAVYVPQAYNIGGNVVVVPSIRVKPLDAEPAKVMTFIVSGGVTGELGETTE
jgi:uncharacterized membrane protein